MGVLPTQNKKIVLIVIVVAIIVVSALGVSVYFYWQNHKKVAPNVLPNGANNITNNTTRGVLPSIKTNAIENKPDVNPVDKANPYKDIKVNPF